MDIKIALVIITNKKKDLFYMQQKDERYFIPKYRLYYTFFGGKLKEDENEEECIKRELKEELKKEVSEIIIKKIKKIDQTPYFYTEFGKRKFFIFNSILDDKELEFISKQKIFEGKKGILIKKEELDQLPIINPVREVIKNYFNLPTISF